MGRDLSKEILNVDGGEVRVWREVLHRGMCRVNLVVWKERGQIILATNTELSEGMVEICRSRMKVERSFGDMKRDLGRGSVMVGGSRKAVRFLFLMAVAMDVGLVKGGVLRGEVGG